MAGCDLEVHRCERDRHRYRYVLRIKSDSAEHDRDERELLEPGRLTAIGKSGADTIGHTDARTISFGHTDVNAQPDSDSYGDRDADRITHSNQPVTVQSERDVPLRRQMGQRLVRDPHGEEQLRNERLEVVGWIRPPDERLA